MRAAHRCIVAIAGCLALLSACVTADPSAIGWVIVDGPEGFLNGTQLKDRDNLPLHSGDHVATGNGTGIKIQLRGLHGTYIQLDENTDPDLIKEAQCVLVRLLKGKLFAQGTGLCFDTPDMAGSVNSEIVLEVQQRKGKPGATRSVLSVLVGHVTLTNPVAMQVTPNQQVSVSRELAPKPETRFLTPDEVRDLTSWRDKHRRLIPVAIIFPTTAPPAPVLTPPPAAPTNPEVSRKSPDKAQIPQGWCCLGGRVEKENALQCSAGKGVFYTSETDARAQCVIVR